MMKIDRLIGIITILLQKEKTTAPALAKRFEVSRRTILRDIDTLCRAGIPIATSQGGDGGISIMEDYKLDKSVLTAEELQNIITGLKSLDSVSKTSGIEQLLLKLAPNRNAMVSLTDSIIIDLSSYYKDSLSDKISLIKKAIAGRNYISFDYYYKKGETRRRIEPYFIEFKWSSWYVFGWCTDRQEFRRFKLNRLWELSMSDEHFGHRHIPAPDDEADDPFSDQYNIKIWFDKSVRFRLIEDYGLGCYEETNEGLLLSLDYTDQEYIFSWVLGFGDKAEILSPQDVRNQFAEVAQKTARRYI